MQKTKEFMRILGISLCPALLLGGAALALTMTAPPPVQAAAKKSLTIGISQFPSTLHPLFDAMVAKSLVLSAALRPVTVYDAGWQPLCLICTELPSFENGLAVLETRKDGKKGIAATYTLKPGLAWGDGTPVTAADILFGWEVGRHPASGVSNGEFFAKDIVDITSDAPDRFTIHFDKEKCDFALINDFYPLPAHLERTIFAEDPANYKNRTLYNTRPDTPGLYFGPYRIAAVTAGAAITLEKNPAWAGKAPAFDTVTFKTVENSSALTAHLLSGSIDYIAGELGLTLDQALSFEKRLNAAKPGKYNVIYKPGLTYEHIDLPLDKKPFDDVRLRKALLLGMNRAQINDAVFGGKQPVAKSNINPLDTVYTDDVTAYPYDPAAAEKLLEEAGWVKKPDGYRYNGEGKKLSISFSTTAGNKSREMIQQAIQSDWKKIGVDAVIKNEPARVLFGDTMRQRRFDGGIMYAWLSTPNNIPKTTLHSTMIPSAENNYAGQNYPGYSNPAMDKLIDDLDITCDAAANKALWQDLQKLYADDLPALPLYYRADSFFVPVWLHGLTPTGHQHPSTLWIENWSHSP